MKKINYSYLILISLVSAMGGLLFGYDWVVIGGAKPFYEPFFGIVDNPLLQGWTMSSAPIGWNSSKKPIFLLIGVVWIEGEMPLDAHFWTIRIILPAESGIFSAKMLPLHL